MAESSLGAGRAPQTNIGQYLEATMKFEYLAKVGKADCDLYLGKIKHTGKPIAIIESALPSKLSKLDISGLATIIYHQHFRNHKYGMGEIRWLLRNHKGVLTHVIFDHNLGSYRDPIYILHPTRPVLDSL
jgi:hypothetical protein